VGGYDMKVCKKCGVEKPLTTDFFHRCKRMKDGFKSECKECRLVYNNDIRKKHPEIERNYRIKNKERIKENRKKYRYKSKEQEYYLANKQKIKSYSKQYYLENKDTILLKALTYYENNKEEAKNYSKAYLKTDRGKQLCTLRKHKRKSRFKKVIATLTITQWEMCKKHFDYKCAYCGAKDLLEQEHFVPLSKGGEYTRKNIIPACKSCNASKNNKSFFDWYPNHKNYSNKREQIILKYLEYEDKTQQIAFF
jgi:5-methylcytosine-specific restriction endonuclease McrA